MTGKWSLFEAHLSFGSIVGLARLRWFGLFGRVRAGLTWFEMVWSCLVLFGLVWVGLIWFGLVRVWFWLVWSGLV